ncbi:hypothetical protein C8F04DRAFT_1396672 [Mycena alexandri]|uniref:Uncharacterized protein n=1 Tax=Mycena alexandri TaxID=1745969 RepID=A0AAD6SS56_9AGAR|nr:hypothetical protein C8F04DRAFT_1396672 [Mycena alexandri]
MDSDTQPLLADHDVEANIPHEHSKTGDSQHQHICSRCASELSSKTRFKLTLRHILLAVGIVLACSIFSFLVVQMSVADIADVHTVFVAIWTDVTVTALAFLLYLGGHRKFGRTAFQVRALCALGFSWIALMAGMISQNVNGRVCHWASTCGWFSTAHVLSWLLIVVLFSAAYATYHRAVTVHGTALVPILDPQPMVAAWRLASVTDNEGSVKI